MAELGRGALGVSVNYSPSGSTRPRRIGPTDMGSNWSGRMVDSYTSTSPSLKVNRT